MNQFLTCVPICLFSRARSLRCIACSFRLLQRGSSHDSVVRCHLLRKCSSQLMLIRPQASLLPYDPYLPCPLPRLVGQALTRLVTVSSMCYHTSTLPYLPRRLQGFTSLRMGYLILRGFTQMPSAFIPSGLGYPAMALASQPVHQRSVHPGPSVLRTAPLRYPTPTPDRDRTVSRRSEPSSRTALMGEQPNPWDLLQPQDAMSRHRGAKPLRRCELLGVISLLSPG